MGGSNGVKQFLKNNFLVNNIQNSQNSQEKIDNQNSQEKIDNQNNQEKINNQNNQEQQDNQCIKILKLQDLNDKLVAIDASGFIYRAKNNFGVDKWWLEIFNFIQKFKYKVLFVFDGQPPPNKLTCIKKRKEREEKVEEKSNINNVKYIKNSIKLEDINKCKEVCDYLGIPYLHIETVEADEIFPYLIECGIVDSVFSQDNDMIRRGCKNIYCDIDYNNNTILKINYDLCLTQLNITREQFNNAYDSAGTDYNDNLEYCKFKDTIELMRIYGTIEKVLSNLDNINSGKIVRIIKSPKSFNFIKTREIFDRKLPESIIQEINSKINNFQNKFNNIKLHIVEYGIKLFNKIEMISDKDANKYIKKVKSYYLDVFDLYL
jgi:5'-3' exonuclease